MLDCIWFRNSCKTMKIKSLTSKKIIRFRFCKRSDINIVKSITRGSPRRCSIKKGDLKNFAKLTGKHLCQSLFFNKAADLSLMKFEDEACNFIKKETLAQVFSCKFY